MEELSGLLNFIEEVNMANFESKGYQSSQTKLTT